MIKKLLISSVFALGFVVFIISPAKALTNSNDAEGASGILGMPGQAYFQNSGGTSQSGGPVSASFVSNELRQLPSGTITVDSPASSSSQITNTSSSNAWIIVLLSVLAVCGLTSFGYMVTDTTDSEVYLDEQEEAVAGPEPPAASPEEVVAAEAESTPVIVEEITEELEAAEVPKVEPKKSKKSKKKSGKRKKNHR
jgi:hypothetical protein